MGWSIFSWLGRSTCNQEWFTGCSILSWPGRSACNQEWLPASLAWRRSTTARRTSLAWGKKTFRRGTFSRSSAGTSSSRGQRNLFQRQSQGFFRLMVNMLRSTFFTLPACYLHSEDSRPTVGGFCSPSSAVLWGVELLTNSTVSKRYN